MKTLYDELVSYSRSDFYGFHMPGHKRNAGIVNANLPYNIDITEIDGFDDLHHATGFIRQIEKRAADLYKAEESCYLINGSTAGILSAILGCTAKGDRILAARNCHKSVYHAIFLNELEPVYLYPQFESELELNGEILADDVRDALETYPDITAVVITSPTYDGVISDISQIAQCAHQYGVPLIVDEAHGAHFGFHPYFSENANVKGGDIVIHSLHKTLPALTQTALIHMNGGLVNRKKVHYYLQMFQSSSPSYVLMSSIDSCVEMLESRGKDLFGEYVRILKDFRRELGGLKHLKLLETGHFDKSKIIISVKHTSYTSRQLYRELREKYHLQMEMAAGSYVLGMTTIGDTEDAMRRFLDALREIDRGAVSADKTRGVKFEIPRTQKVYSSAVMLKMVNEAIVDGSKGNVIKSIPWRQCIGCISTEYAYLYPPGIPLIVPGERITGSVVELLEQYKELKFTIEGLEREGFAEVWINE